MNDGGTGAEGPLITLLGLEEVAIKAATPTQLAFVMVNDTRSLAEYRQAALHITGKGLVAVSGVSAVEAHAPFTLWLERVFRAIEAGQAIAPRDAEEWDDWLPEQPLWLPLTGGDGRRVGTLLLAADSPWPEGTVTLVQRLADVYGFAWAARHRPSALARWRSRLSALPFWRVGLAAALGVALLIPVRLSVLAPAEIVPSAPAVIRAPLDGVIETVLVRPNQEVTSGQVLFELDRTTVGGKLEVAAKALSTARAELDQATQQAFFDPKAKAQLAVIKARVEEKQAEHAQLNDLLERAQVRAPRDGVAVMDDPSEWIGRPVSVGEKVLAVAAPAEVEVEAWLAPADAIVLEPEAPVTVFLNIAPLAPVAARLSYMAFEATLQPDGLLAHRVRARIVEGEPGHRLGLKGTARLDGQRVPVVYWLFRRPLSVVRQWLGW